MRVDILVVSYAKDAEWTRYCLASIQKFARGFGSVFLVVPRQHLEHFDKVPARIHAFDERPAPLGHLHHLLMKCTADEISPYADFILHLDADCIFAEPVTPEDYFVDGKPVLLYQAYDSMTEDCSCWKQPTQDALGFEVEYEFMRRHPAVHYRQFYKVLRHHVSTVNKQPFADYLFSRKPNFPVGFSEFNALGALAFHQGWDYHFIDLAKEPRPPDKLIQFWSHGKLDEPQDIWLDGKKINVVPRQVIDEVLK